MTTNLIYQQQTESLVKILKSKYGVEVEFNEENAFYILDKKIEINKHQNAKSKYYTLLHEAGHIYLRADPEFSSQFPLNESRIHKKCKKHRIELLREEFEAWRVCKDLAKENDLLYEMEVVDGMRDKYLYQYVNWVVHPSKYE